MTTSSELFVTLVPAEDETECERLGLRRIYMARHAGETVWTGEANSADHARALAELAMQGRMNMMTDEHIETLRDEAAAAGDLEQVAICDRALEGDKAARLQCEQVMAHAAAQRD